VAAHPGLDPFHRLEGPATDPSTLKPQAATLSGTARTDTRMHYGTSKCSSTTDTPAWPFLPNTVFFTAPDSPTHPHFLFAFISCSLEYPPCLAPPHSSSTLVATPKTSNLSLSLAFVANITGTANFFIEPRPEKPFYASLASIRNC
jgi:hypothetical protein